MAKVETSGYNVTDLLGGVELKGKFRMLLDKNGQPIKGTEIDGLKRTFLDNGAWDGSKSVLVAGDFNQAVYSIRQDITYKVLDQAVIQDPATGEILYNLAQEDMVALRVVMRLGWQIPNPVNALDETETRFPFASLKPAATNARVAAKPKTIDTMTKAELIEYAKANNIEIDESANKDVILTTIKETQKNG